MVSTARLVLVLGALGALPACGGARPHVCTAYDAAREAACSACARMPEFCPFHRESQ